MLPAKFGSIWPSCFRGEDFFSISQSGPPQATLVSDWLIFSSPCQRQGELLPSLSVRCPLTFHILILFSIDASYQVSVHFAKRFQRRFLTRGSVGWACIAHLTIEWYWSKFQREIIITLKNNSNLEWRVGLSDTILKHDNLIKSEWWSLLFSANAAIFQLYHGGNMLIFNEMMMSLRVGRTIDLL
jgi:hypothetical protein